MCQGRNARLTVAVALCLAAACSVDLRPAPPAARKIVAATASAQSVHGPFAYRNLAVYIVCGAGSADSTPVVTLEEAMERKLITVHETGSVGELAVSNHSRDTAVFLMAGDIVRGGRQDRVLKHSLMVSGGAKNMPVESFCVEPGRWAQRGREDDRTFASSSNRLVSKELKLAARIDADQGKVWEEVGKTRQKLAAHALPATSPQADSARAQPEQTINQEPRISERTLMQSRRQSAGALASSSSLELAVEDPSVVRTTQTYVDSLEHCADSFDSALGMAFAVNGQLNSSDILASHALFVKLWRKMLKAAAVEATAEYDPNAQFVAPPADTAVARWLDEGERGRVADSEVNAQTDLSVTESDSNVRFDAYAKGDKSKWIHKSQVKK